MDIPIPENKPQRKRETKRKTARKLDDTPKNCCPDPEICRIAAKYLPDRPSTDEEKAVVVAAFFGACTDADPNVEGDKHAQFEKKLAAALKTPLIP